jgi:alcohol dehydrogenase class IV
MAFSNASVALVHGMSRPIGVHFHVPHGMGNAMLLPTITAFSLNGAPERYQQCAVHLGLAPADSRCEEAHQQLLTWLNLLNQRLRVPTLSAFGVVKSEYDERVNLMVEQAFSSGSPMNNPRIPSHEELTALYRAVWA